MSMGTQQQSQEWEELEEEWEEAAEDGLVSSCKVVHGQTEVSCDMLPLLHAAPPGMRDYQWPPTPAAIVSSPQSLSQWLTLAVQVKSEALAREEDAEHANFFIAGASMARNETFTQQLQRLPNVVKAQIIVILGLIGLIFASSVMLFVVAADPISSPSTSACIFAGFIQIVSLFLFLFFYTNGVWYENAFQMDTATVVLAVLVLFIFDRTVTSLSISDGWWWIWSLNSLSDCAANATSAAAAALTDQSCCTVSSIAFQCAALTVVNHDLAQSTTNVEASIPALTGVCLVAFIVLEVLARRTFGWRYFKTKSYDKDARLYELRNVRYRVVTSVDLFVNLLWHCFLVWWTVAAVFNGFQIAWVVMSVLLSVMYIIFEVLVLLVSSRFRFRTALLAVGTTHRLPQNTELKTTENLNVRFSWWASAVSTANHIPLTTYRSPPYHRWVSALFIGRCPSSPSSLPPSATDSTCCRVPTSASRSCLGLAPSSSARFCSLARSCTSSACASIRRSASRRRTP